VSPDELPVCGRLPVVPVWGSIVETEGANEVGRLGIRVDGFRFPEKKDIHKILGLQSMCPTTWYHGNGPRFVVSKLLLLLPTGVVSDFLTFLAMIEVTMKCQAACGLRQEPFGRAPSRCVAFGMALFFCISFLRSVFGCQAV